MSTITLIAFTHRTAPLPILERLAFDPGSADAAAAVLCAMRDVEEAVVLSTCNRTEVYLAGDGVDSEPCIEALAMSTGTPLSLVTAAATVASDADASLHLFRVTAGLESRIVGERQILGQVRTAAARAVRAGTAGPELSALLRWAVAGARRANRLGLVARPPSLARAALDAIGSKQGTSVPVLVIGAGAMAAAVTNELAHDHVPYLVCARRTVAAARLTRHPEDAVHLDDIGHQLRRAELVVCTTGASTPIIPAGTVADAVRGRDGNLELLDLSMPRNIDPAVARLPGVTLWGLDDLVAVRMHPSAERLSVAIAAEHRRYRLWLAGRVEGELIASIRARVHDVCLTEAVRVLGAGPDTDEVARCIARKLAHGPTVRIKELRACGDDTSIGVLAAAYGLAPPAAQPPPGSAVTSPRPSARQRGEDVVTSCAPGVRSAVAAEGLRLRLVPNDEPPGPDPGGPGAA